MHLQLMTWLIHPYAIYPFNVIASLDQFDCSFIYQCSFLQPFGISFIVLQSFIHPSFHSPILPFFLSIIYPSIHLSIHPSIHPSFLLSFYSFILPSFISSLHSFFLPSLLSSFHSSILPSFLSFLLPFFLSFIHLTFHLFISSSFFSDYEKTSPSPQSVMILEGLFLVLGYIFGHDGKFLPDYRYVMRIFLLLFKKPASFSSSILMMKYFRCLQIAEVAS